MTMAGTEMQVCTDPVILNEWHAVADLDEIRRGELHTVLLGERMRCSDRCRRHGPGRGRARTGSSRFAPTTGTCGPPWVSPREGCSTSPRPARTTGELSTPSPSASRCRRRGRWRTSWTWLISRTCMRAYSVRSPTPRWPSTGSRSATASCGPATASSTSRVPPRRPRRLCWPPTPTGCRIPTARCCTSRHRATSRGWTAIGIFIHPLTETRIRAHLFISVLDAVSADREIRRFQQEVIAQDKPILENQHPKLLPLDPRAETPIRADRSAIAYRRWLSRLGVTYGVIPAVEGMRI